MNPSDSQPVFDDPDFDIHRIWYCRDSNNPEIDFVFVPAIGATEITEAVCRGGTPYIPLHVEDTLLQCAGYFDVNKDTVFGLTIFMVGEWRHFSYVDAPRTPAVVVSDVPIFGIFKRRFLQRGEKDWYAEKLDA